MIIPAQTVTGNQNPPEHGPVPDLNDLCRIALETTAEAILLLDERARILFANSATSRLFRYEPAELIGLSLMTLIPQASGECGVTELAGLGKAGEELRSPFRYRPCHPGELERELDDARESSSVRASNTPLVPPP